VRSRWRIVRHSRGNCSAQRELHCGTYEAHLALAQTCRVLRAEYLEHFYAHTQFSIKAEPSNLFGGGAAGRMSWRRLPLEQLRLDMVRHVRVLVSLDPIDSGSYVDVAPIVGGCPRLRTLDLAFTLPVRAYMGKHNAGQWGQVSHSPRYGLSDDTSSAGTCVSWLVGRRGRYGGAEPSILQVLAPHVRAEECG
jgi:hypothetical protein